MGIIKIILCTLLVLTPSYAAAGQAEDMQLLFLKAFSKKKVAAPPQLTVDLNIDDQPHEQIMVFVNKQKTFDRVKADDLLVKLKPILKEAVYEDLLKALGEQTKITFDWLKKHDIKARYDAANLSLDIVIKPTLREPLILSLLQNLSSSVRKDNKISPSKVSGYLNLYSNVELSSVTSGGTEHSSQFQLEGSLTVNKATLQSSLTKNSETLELSNTYLTYDEPEKLRRYRLGNVNTVARNFQKTMPLKGGALTKDFTLDKSQEAQPKASESLILATRSDVIVYLNKIQVQQYSLAAGTYRLEDIGLREGQNDIELKIIDAFGKETIKQSSQLFDTRLLKPGLSKYAFSVGLHNESDEFAASGVYQYGVTDTLTLGGDAQVLKDKYLLGAEGLTVVKQGAYIGGFALTGDLSRDEIGAAAKLAFKSSNRIGENPLRWRVGGEYHSKLFNASMADTAADGDGLKHSFQVSARKKIFDQWSSSLSIAHNSYYQLDDSLLLNLNASTRFGKNISFNAGVSYDTDNDWSVNSQLSMLLTGKSGRRKRLGLTTNSKDNTFESRYEVKAKNAIGKDSLSGNFIIRKTESGFEERAEGSVRYPDFESRFSVSHSRHGDVDQQNIQVGINASLACVAKNCLLSHPISDSFALIGGPKNQKQTIPLNTGNGRFVYSEDEDSLLPQSYAALIVKRGSMAVVHLDAYTAQRITVDEVSLPFGYNPEKTEFEVSPRYHQGFSFRVGGEPGTVVDGVLVDPEGKPLGFKGGQWVEAKNKDKAIAFFSNKAGKFRISSIAPGTYQLDLHDYPSMQTVKIVVKTQDRGIQDLGTITVHP